MFVSIDLCLVPIGVGTSLSPYIKECIEVIKSEGLSYELGANGTAIEGDWDKVFECVRKCHEKIHEKGNDVKIRWVYNNDEDGNFELGNDYAEMVSLPFEFIETVQNFMTSI